MFSYYFYNVRIKIFCVKFFTLRLEGDRRCRGQLIFIIVMLLCARSSLEGDKSARGEDIKNRRSYVNLR